MSRTGRRLLPAPALLLVGALGCGSCGDSPSGRDAGAPPPPDGAAVSTSRATLDLVDALPGCELEHRGLLLDLGTDAVLGRLGWRWTVPPGLPSAEHDGSTWTRVFDRSFDLAFVLSEPTPIFVSARALGAASRAIAVSVDDQPLGTLTLARDQIKIATTPTTNLPLDRGPHTLTLRMSGRAPSGTRKPTGEPEGEPFAEIDWVRVGIQDEDTSTFGPPTLRDVVAPAAALAGVPHRALALRARGAIRCPLRPPRGGKLRVALGLSGAGEGEAELRYVRDGHPPEVLATVPLVGGEAARWTDVEVPFGPSAGAVGAVELRAAAASRGTRVLFGDPAITVPSAAPAPTPAARAVVVVILDGVERADLPPWSAGPSPLPTLAELALVSTSFDRHRAPTTVIGAVVASLLTGLPPRGHTLTDLGARLPAAQTTIASIAREASVRTAMFTGVPTTFGAFGFGRGWEKWVEHSPVSGGSATAPIDDAATWITEVARESPEAKLLVFVHARGAHPPWQVTPKEISQIPPPDYAGMIEPRRAAQVLARARQRRSGAALSPTDAARVRALAGLALAGQDRALGALVAALRTAGLWDQTLLVVTGDVGSGASEQALFAEGTELRESVLALPLTVRFPGGAHGGVRVDAPTEVFDVTRTGLAALGLVGPKEGLGRELSAIASGLEDSASAPQFATLGERYSTRWGDLVLSGAIDAPPHLCDLSVDPTCAFNRRDIVPHAARAMFQGTVLRDARTRTPPERREPATVDADTGAALNVWGAGE